MPAEWIKMRAGLRDDPQVIQLAAELDTDEYHIVGILHHFWSWADAHVAPDCNGDGNAVGVTPSWIDRYTGVAGFAETMQKVGWLRDGPNGIIIPNFREHNGESAKKRAQTAKRVKKSRSANRNADVTQPPLQGALLEENREELIEPPIDIPPTKKKRKVFKKPTLDEVTAYCNERENKVDPQAFIDHYESNGWKVGRNPMKDWKAAIRTWERNRFDNDDEEDGSKANWSPQP